MCLVLVANRRSDETVLRILPTRLEGQAFAILMSSRQLNNVQHWPLAKSISGNHVRASSLDDRCQLTLGITGILGLTDPFPYAQQLTHQVDTF